MHHPVKVFGIDVIGGSVRSRTRRPSYALVRMENREIVSEQEVSQFRLLRMLAIEQPDILAVDSIQELAADQHDLFIFLQGLPPNTMLVQVTGGERKESLGKVASRYNISFNRFDPFDEARTIARVASLGAGAEVIAFENTTDVVVSRHRSPGKGGWSQNRYVRKIHGAVQLRGREIEMALLAAGLKYEKRETHAFGGCSRVAFRVFAPRDRIPVPTHRGADIQVKISGRRLDRIRFRSVSGRPKYLIVGIDPGTTTATAALDLEGNLVHIDSSRQTSMASVIESLYRIGKPLVIATDVQEMPFSVEKIRRAFQAVSFSPKQDMSVEQKTASTAPFPVRNDHERDALSAALEAHRIFRHKLAAALRRVPPGFDLEEVQAGLIRGQSLEQILADLRGKVAPDSEAAPAPEVSTKGDERVRVLDGTVKRLREYIRELQQRLVERETEISRYQARLRKARSARDERLKKEQDITTRDSIIQGLKRKLRHVERSNEKLRKRLDQVRQIDSILESGDSAPVKVLESLTREGVRTLADSIGIRPGDLLFVRRIGGWGRGAVKELLESRIQAVIAGELANMIDPELDRAFFEMELPLLIAEDMGGILIRGRYGIVDRERLSAAMNKRAQGQEAFRRKEEAGRIETLLASYQVERGKEMKKVG